MARPRSRLFVGALLLLLFGAVGPADAQQADAGPQIPKPEPDQHILFDSSTPDDLDRGSIEDCFADFSSVVLAEYRIYIFSTAEGTRLDEIPSLHGFADRAHQTFRETGWYDGHRGVLLLFDAADEQTGVETGNRWSIAEFDSFKPSPGGLDYDSPAQHICHLAEKVEASLGRRLRRDDLEQLDDVRARLNLVEGELDHLDAELEKLEERANGIAGPRSSVARGIRHRLPTQLRQTLQTRLEEIWTKIETNEEDPAGLRPPLDELERQVRELSERTYDTSSVLSEFETVHPKLESLDAQLSRLRKRLAERRRTQPLWLGADGAADRLDTCRQKQQALRRRVESGDVPDRAEFIAIEECMSRVVEQLEATSPTTILLTQFLPALFAILTALGLALFLYRRFEARSKLRAEIDALHDQWHSDLDYIDSRLRPLEQRHTEAFEYAERVVEGDARTADADEAVRDIVEAAALDIALRRRLEQAATARQSAGWIGLGDLQAVVDLLDEEPIVVGDYQKAPVTALEDAQVRAEQAADAHGGRRL